MSHETVIHAKIILSIILKNIIFTDIANVHEITHCSRCTTLNF